MAAQGGTVLEPTWLGVAKGHLIRCANGHESRPQPQYLLRGGFACSTCGYASRTPKRSQRSLDSEANFRAAVAEQGASVEGDWVDASTPVLVRCAKGHLSMPRPANVNAGQGFCLRCTWQTQDVVYVVWNEALGHVKLGITSGDPAGRLKEHRANGFRDELRVWRGLPEGVAYAAEQEALKRMRAAGARPVEGTREYFEGIWAGLAVDTLSAILHPHL